MAAGASGIGMTDSVYQSLLANRIIFLGSEVRDENEIGRASCRERV